MAGEINAVNAIAASGAEFLGTGAVAAPHRYPGCRASSLQLWPELGYAVAWRFFAECGSVFSLFGVEGIGRGGGGGLGRSFACTTSPGKASSWLRLSPKIPLLLPRGCDPVARSRAVGAKQCDGGAGEVTDPKGGRWREAKEVGCRHRRFSAVFSSRLCCLLVHD